MSSKSRVSHLLGLLLVTGALFALVLIGFTAWRHTLPHWELATANAPDGIVVQLFEEKSPKPTYVVRMKGLKLKQPFPRQTYAALKSTEIVTTHYDDTLPPGAWVFQIGGTEIKAWEAGIIVGRRVDGRPGDAIEYDLAANPSTSP